MTIVHDRLTATIDAATGGRASAIHLHGPRGCGKTWWLDQAARYATEHDMTVSRARGSAEDGELPFAALSALLAPFRDRLDDPAWTVLRQVVSFDHRHVDAFEVKIAALQLLCALAGERPLCLLLDDIHLFDAASTEVLAFTMRRAEADSIACISTSTHDRSATSTATVRLDPMTAPSISTMLVARGLGHVAAARCAEAADGNPGIAIALADGLTEAQRAGSAPVAVLPRPSGGLADDLQNRLREHGEAVCRSLVVAAAEHGGDTAAVRAALVSLGESSEGFDTAESLGLLDIVGARFAFTDPWIRTVAYHLVAPSSRRAAHRALAAWFAGPAQAAERAWHLAAGADGPSDAVAEALELVAADTARRGGLASAALTAERAAEFATSPARRQGHLLAALQWWMDAAATDGVRRIAGALDPLDCDAATARAEAIEFIGGGRGGVVWDDATPGADGSGTRGREKAGRWTIVRERRLAIEAAAESGDHRAVLRAAEQHRVREHGSAAELVALAASLRHAGRVRDARDVVIRASAILDGSAAFPEWVAALVGIDLDVLQGRGDDALAALEAMRGMLPVQLHERAAALGGRARLQRDPTLTPAFEAVAFTPLGEGVLLEIRESVRAGALDADPSALKRAVELAEKHSLPVEAGEARLWLGEQQSASERRDNVTLCRATLQRCGVRGWDSRLEHCSAGDARAASVRRADPALDALSQAEFRVAAAVAGGLTNREVAATLLISVKTVDFHLQQMYRKLGIRSRTELAVRMTRQQESDDE